MLWESRQVGFFELLEAFDWPETLFLVSRWAYGWLPPSKIKDFIGSFGQLSKGKKTKILVDAVYAALTLLPDFKPPGWSLDERENLEAERRRRQQQQQDQKKRQSSDVSDAPRASQKESITPMLTERQSLKALGVTLDTSRGQCDSGSSSGSDGEVGEVEEGVDDSGEVEKDRGRNNEEKSTVIRKVTKGSGDGGGSKKKRKPVPAGHVTDSAGTVARAKKARKSGDGRPSMGIVIPEPELDVIESDSDDETPLQSVAKRLRDERKDSSRHVKDRPVSPSGGGGGGEAAGRNARRAADEEGEEAAGRSHAGASAGAGAAGEPSEVVQRMDPRKRQLAQWSAAADDGGAAAAAASAAAAAATAAAEHRCLFVGNLPHGALPASVPRARRLRVAPPGPTQKRTHTPQRPRGRIGHVRRADARPGPALAVGPRAELCAPSRRAATWGGDAGGAANAREFQVRDP